MEDENIDILNDEERLHDEERLAELEFDGTAGADVTEEMELFGNEDGWVDVADRREYSGESASGGSASGGSASGGSASGGSAAGGHRGRRHTTGHHDNPGSHRSDSSGSRGFGRREYGRRGHGRGRGYKAYPSSKKFDFNINNFKNIAVTLKY